MTASFRCGILAILLTTVLCENIGAQSFVDIHVTGNDIKLSRPITFLIDSTGVKDFSDIQRSAFTTSSSDFQNAFQHHAFYNFWISFSLENHTGRSDTLYMMQDIADIVTMCVADKQDKFHTHHGGYGKVKKLTTPYVEQLAIPFIVAPGHTTKLFVCMNNSLSPDWVFNGITLYDKQQLHAVHYKNYYHDSARRALQLIFQGFILCQVLYVLFQWFIIRKKEYIYYMFYMFAIGLYFFIRYNFAIGLYWPFGYNLLLSYNLENLLTIFPYYLYFLFVGSFLELSQKYPEVDYWLSKMKILILISIALTIGVLMTPVDPYASLIIINIATFIVFIVCVALIIYLLRKREPLINFILIGSLFAGLGNVIGLLITGIDSSAPAQVGILLEICFFTAGLSYKAKLNEEEKIEHQRKYIEQLQANEKLQYSMQHIRNKIAQDLHDDIGTTLSTILLYSNAAQQKHNTLTSEETQNLFSRIGNSAMTMINEMNDIVWAINPRNDTTEKIFNRMMSFASPLLTASQIEFSFSLGDDIKHEAISMDKRKNLYLIFKEAINNALKYSRCTKIEVSLQKIDQQIKMNVTDNGIGFESDAGGQGNGLINMQQRAAEMKGSLVILPVKNKGTTISLTFSMN